MARHVKTPDVGKYNRPALVQQRNPTWVDNGQGGNANANNWVTVRGGGSLPLMILLESGNFGRGLGRTFQFGQQYPTASHWAEMLYAPITIDPSMTLVIDPGLSTARRYQILGAIDHERANVITILALVEWQAKGSQ